MLMDDPKSDILSLTLFKFVVSQNGSHGCSSPVSTFKSKMYTELSIRGKKEKLVTKMGTTLKDITELVKELPDECFEEISTILQEHIQTKQ
jgi:hypothetical protein